jgi:hypothetical protein
MAKWKGWIGVDLDGVLAEYHNWNGGKIGKPIPRMVERVKTWLTLGIEVRIFTSRVGSVYPDQRRNNVEQIEKFCKDNFQCILRITNEKDQDMIELWDDRAVQMVKNKGMTIQEYWSLEGEDG